MAALTPLPVFNPPKEDTVAGGFNTPVGWRLDSGKLFPLFPRGDLTTGREILAALGSFWSRHFEDKAELLSHIKGSSIHAVQAYIDWLETLASVSRFSIPIFHRRQWYAIVIKESELNLGDASLLKYGEGVIYDSTYRYGVAVANEFQAVELTEISNVSLILNRIVDPSLSWINGTDFFVENKLLLLRNNPFKNVKIPVNNILDTSGSVIDREVVLWGFNTAEDWHHIYEHFGYAIRRKFDSSEDYRDFVNALWNGLVGGLNTQDFEWAVAAAAGLPVVKETREIVEAIIPYPGRKTAVVTDQHGYIYPADSVARVTVGTIVYSGQTLVDTIRTFDLANFDDVTALIKAERLDDAGRLTTLDTLTASSSAANFSPAPVYLGHRSATKLKPSSEVEPLLFALLIDRSLLGSGYSGALSFRNVVGVIDESNKDSNGITIGKISHVGGGTPDLDLFWNTAHANGIASGKTWLDLLGVPKLAYANPAGWVIEHFLSNNTIVVALRYTKFGKTKLGLQLLELLRRVLAPEKMVIYLVDVEIKDEEAINVTPDCLFPAELTSSSSPIECVGIETLTVPATVITSLTTGVISVDPLIFDANACE